MVLGIKGLRFALVAVLSVAFSATVFSQEIVGQPGETPEQRDARMKWWREARFGMFIHWGVYSVPAGTYKGKQISGIGEWIMNRGKIPVAEYKQFASQFNPVRYDPDAWVQLGQGSGHEVHRHHVQAPRRLRPVRFEGHRLGRGGRHALRQGPAQAAVGGLRKARPGAGLLLLAGPGLEPSGRRGRRRALGPRPGRRHGRLHPQHRRPAGERDPLQLRQARRPLVGHARGHDQRTCGHASAADWTCSRGSSRTTGSAAATAATSARPSSISRQPAPPAATGKPA